MLKNLILKFAKLWDSSQFHVLDVNHQFAIGLETNSDTYMQVPKQVKC